jgi:hypothetical protein
MDRVAYIHVPDSAYRKLDPQGRQARPIFRFLSSLSPRKNLNGFAGKNATLWRRRMMFFFLKQKKKKVLPKTS